MKKLFILLAAGLGIGLLSGCANHMRYVYQKEPKVKRLPAGEEFFMEVKRHGNSEEILNLKISKMSKTKVQRYELTIKKDVSTPYSGWREFYEMPAGFGMFPVALIVNTLDFATLGLIPNDLTDDSLDICCTGLNPFLNWESESRAQFTELETKSKMIDESFENLRAPGAGQKVLVYAEDTVLSEQVTNRKGNLDVDLMSPELLPKVVAVRELYFSAGDGQGRAIGSFIVDRQLIAKLRRTRQLIDAYQKKPSPELLAETILELEKLNFKKAALCLEKTQISEHNSEFEKAFNSAIDKCLLGAN